MDSTPRDAGLVPDTPRADAGALDAAAAVAARVTRPSAGDVDRDARFPAETFAALREAGLLRALIPERYGGLGCSVDAVARMCTVLARSCGSSGLVFAMHQIQIACLVRHAGDAHADERLARIARDSPLIASATSEVGTHGDLRSSVAAIETTPGDARRLRKLCPAISFGAQADAVLVTARRAPDAAASDQSLVWLERGDYRLEQTGRWDPLGMRGTCSPAFTLDAEFAPERVLPTPFRDIAAQTMVPYSHLFWAAAWLGIATDAVAVARSVYQATARQAAAAASFSAAALTEAMTGLDTLRALVRNAPAVHAEFEPLGRGGSVATMIAANSLKLGASELVCRITFDCLRAGGLRSYGNHEQGGLGRHIRDALSAPIMISNGRLAGANATLLQIDKSSL